MPWKITMLLQQATGLGAGGPPGQQHLGGWSESVYSIASNIAEVRNMLYNPGVWGLGLCPARAVLMSGGGQIVGTRIASVLPRTGRTQTSGRSFIPPFSAQTDVPQMALMCTVGAVGSPNTRRFTLRGIPDNMVTFGEYNPTTLYRDWVLAYFNELRNWSFVGQDLAQPFLQVNSISATGTVLLAAPRPPGFGGLLKFSQLLIPGTGIKIGGRFKIATVGPGANEFDLLNYPGPATTGGTVQMIVYSIYPMDGANATADRAAVRKVGRPFGQYRGRRSKSNQI